MRGLRGRTDTDVNLTSCDFVSDLSDGSQTGGALPVDGVDSGCIGDASCQSGHASSRGATAGRKDVSDGDVFDERWVEAGFCVRCTKDFAEDLVWLGVLETAFPSLTSRRW